MTITIWISHVPLTENYWHAQRNGSLPNAYCPFSLVSSLYTPHHFVNVTTASMGVVSSSQWAKNRILFQKPLENRMLIIYGQKNWWWMVIEVFFWKKDFRFCVLSMCVTTRRVPGAVGTITQSVHCNKQWFYRYTAWTVKNYPGAVSVWWTMRQGKNLTVQAVASLPFSSFDYICVHISYGYIDFFVNKNGLKTSGLWK